MTLPINIQQWLQERGITATVAAVNGLGWKNNQLVIPIKDPSGKVLFNKYRRNPFGPIDVPKYKYEVGTTAQLFNAHKIKEAKYIVICEGEMDAMRLEAAGIVGVTSTGGAGTFKDEWIELLAGKELCVCYDNDDAGLKGAIKLLTKLQAKLVLIPKLGDVKDVTDFFNKKNLAIDQLHVQNLNYIHFLELLRKAEKYPILSDPLPEFTGIGDRTEQIRKYKSFIDEQMEKIRKAKNTRQQFNHLEAINRLLLVAISNLEREIKRVRFAKKPINTENSSQKITEEDIARAKEVPLETLFSGPLRRMGNKMTGHCPFHNERTGSFTIYIDQNTFYCYGCSAGRDAIDFVMRQDDCEFLDAVRKMLNK